MPFPFIILFPNRQIRQLGGHDASRTTTRHDRVPGKVGHAGVVPEEILVEEELSIDDGGGGLEDGEDGV